MTENGNLKRDIRARMAATGEAYVVARRAVMNASANRADPPPADPGPVDAADSGADVAEIFGVAESVDATGAADAAESVGVTDGLPAWLADAAGDVIDGPPAWLSDGLASGPFSAPAANPTGTTLRNSLVGKLLDAASAAGRDQTRRVRRAALVGRLFDAAASVVRYPVEAQDVPGTWVRVDDWDGDAFARFTVAYPTRWDALNPARQRELEDRLRQSVGTGLWTFRWETDRDRLVATTTRLPPRAAMPDGDPHPWNEFPLGIAEEDGREAVWSVDCEPHMLLAGPTGSGKSGTQRVILLHALQSPVWRIAAIDPQMVELAWLAGKDNVLRVATSLAEGVEVCEGLSTEMNRRYDLMQEQGVNYFTDLVPQPPALLCMVDETFAFLAPEGIKSDEGKARDVLHARAKEMIGLIARLGRAAGFHLVLATQRPETSVIRGELKNNLDCRIATGRMDTTPSLVVLDSEAATRIPAIKGRGIMRTGATLTEYQSYYIATEEVDGWLRRRRAERH